MFFTDVSLVPLFWSQSPYSLHPIPTLDRSEEENATAFERHFATQEQLYGQQIAVNLAELTGREAIIGSEYRRHVEKLGDPNIKLVHIATYYRDYNAYILTQGM